MSEDGQPDANSACDEAERAGCAGATAWLAAVLLAVGALAVLAMMLLGAVRGL